MKDLKDKAIDIKGKKYVLVADRVLAFNEAYPEGSITTELVSNLESQNIIIKAMVKPKFKEDRVFTGYAQEKVGDGFINKTSALENAETSAVGRALAMMGIGVLDSIASADEINKANNAPVEKVTKKIEYNETDKQLIIDALNTSPDNAFFKSVAEGFKKYGKLSSAQRASLMKANTVKEVDSVDPKDVPF